VAVFLMLAVLAVCISPAVDLPETALRSSQQALLATLAIIACAMAFSGIELPPPSRLAWLPKNRDCLPAQRFAEDSSLPILC
jgi:hypothetical protein